MTKIFGTIGQCWAVENALMEIQDARDKALACGCDEIWLEVDDDYGSPVIEIRGMRKETEQEFLQRRNMELASERAEYERLKAKYGP